MANGSLVLEARHLVKTFKTTRAVDGFDLTVGPAERVGLLGPNGAGKTTTLLMILGVISATEGTINVAGEVLPRGRSRAMEKVGFVAGYLPLPENLTVRESLEIFAGLAGVRRSKAAIDEAIETFGLEKLIEKRNQELSSGQRTLVSITKATLHKPELLILDEPTASLDPDIAERVRQALLTVHKNLGTALLVTSHNMREVEILCERVVLMSQGRVVANGTPAAIAAQFAVEDLEKAFLAVAAEMRGPRDHEVRP